MEKHYCNPQYFQEKLNYKAKFSTSLILKKIKQTDNFEKNHKKKQKEKNHVRKHSSNLQYFVRKYIIVILNQLNIKKIKLIKIILEKIIKKRKEKKIMQENTIAIYSVSRENLQL